MPQLPQYISQTRARGQVAGAQPGIVDTSGLVQGVQQAANTITNEQKREAAKAQAERDRVTQQLAENEARVATVNAESDIDLKIANRFDEASKTPDGLVGFTDSIMKDFDGWAKEAGENASDAARPHIAVAAARMRGQLNLKAYSAETQYRQGKVVSDYSDGLDADRKLVFADPSQFNVALARRTALVNTLEVPEAVRTKLGEQTREGLAYEAASAIAERQPEAFLQHVGIGGAKTGKDGKPLPTDPKRAADAVANDPVLSNLSPEKLRQVVDRATMLSVQREAQRQQLAEQNARRAEIEASRREREANQAYSILSERTRNGKITDPVADKPLLDKIAGTPYASAYAAQAQQVATSTAAAMLPIGQQQAQLDALKARAASSAGTSTGLETEIKAREQILSSAKTEYAADPIRAASERGVIAQPAPVQLQAGLPGLLQSIGPRLQQSAIVDAQTGKTGSPFTPDEAQQVGQMLLSLPVPEQSRAIAALSEKMGPRRAQALAGQISNHDRPLALAMQAGSTMTTAGRPVAELILRGGQAARDKSVKEDASANAKIAELVGDTFAGQTREDVMDSARLISLGLLSEGSSDPERAVRLAVGGNIIEHAGKRIPVASADVTSESFAAGLARVPASQVTAQSADGKVFAAGHEMPLDQFMAALPSAQLQPAGRGRYFVRAGGGLVTNASRQPIVIEVPLVAP